MPAKRPLQPDVKPISSHLNRWDWYKSIGSPRFILSPMVGQSELAYRLTTRKHGAQLTYTPMIIASEFISNAKYRNQIFQYDASDRPLIVQFCASDPDSFIAAAQLVADKCDAVELNLGCPQDVAKRGCYGSWMMEKQDLIQSILSSAVSSLPIPVTAKIRIFPSFSETLQYCRMLEECGISMLTVHPRLREHREEVLADWNSAVEIAKAISSLPVVLNGDMWGPNDVALAMSLTSDHISAYMCAQGALHCPSIFESLSFFSAYNHRPSLPMVDSSSSEPNAASSDSQAPPTINHKKTKPNSPAQSFSTYFQSTQQEPLSQPESINFYRSRKHTTPLLSFEDDLMCNGSSFSLKVQQLHTKSPKLFSDPTLLNQTILRLTQRIGASDKQQYISMIESYPLLKAQKTILKQSPTHISFLLIIMHMEASIDQFQRQLLNCAEYITFAQKYPPPSSKTIHRHIFFILFDGFQKYIDLYDDLYMAKTHDDFELIVKALNLRAKSGATPTGAKKNSIFVLKRKERPRRRDGTLAPPPWEEGGGGMNVAKNTSASNNTKKEKPTTISLLHTVSDLSKFD